MLFVKITIISVRLSGLSLSGEIYYSLSSAFHYFSASQRINGERSAFMIFNWLICIPVVFILSRH
jgi:hypothetical protein